jgi:hypothetical protein
MAGTPWDSGHGGSVLPASDIPWPSFLYAAAPGFGVFARRWRVERTQAHKSQHKRSPDGGRIWVGERDQPLLEAGLLPCGGLLAGCGCLKLLDQEVFDPAMLRIHVLPIVEGVSPVGRGLPETANVVEVLPQVPDQKLHPVCSKELMRYGLVVFPVGQQLDGSVNVVLDVEGHDAASRQVQPVGLGFHSCVAQLLGGR